MITLKLNRQEQAMLLSLIGSKCFDKKSDVKTASMLYEKIETAKLQNEQAAQKEKGGAFTVRVSPELLPQRNFTTLEGCKPLG